jgi:lycopene beta-cyclase
MTSPRVEIDYAIVGAGVSGLCLAWQLLESPLADRRILLVDGAKDDDVLRTLSFWASAPTPFEMLVQQRWRELLLRGDDGAPLSVPLAEHEYRTLFFADLQRLVKARLAASGHLIVEGRARRVEDRGTHVAIEVDGEEHLARWAFDSRFHLADLAIDARRYHDVRQHFRGVIVRAARAVFDPRAATFMDFRSALPRGRAFFYVLPFDERRALVELVTLDPADTEAELDRYLREELALPDAEILDREAGMSPMTEQPFARRHSDRVRAIGIPAGRLKASTGYAFTRILDDNRAIVDSLARFDHPFAAPAESAFYRVCDAVLLELWTRRPELIPAAFHALFRGQGDRVLRFLDERATLRDLVRIILSVPALPFLYAFFAWLRRRLAVAIAILPHGMRS